MDYRQAGVDIAAGNRAVELMRSLVASTRRPEVLGGIGGFGGLFSVPAGYREPVLVAGADGVGTKLKIAFAMGRHDTVGIDCVAMNVNDILTHGAEPLFFLDYLGVGKLHPEQVAGVVAGVAEGCRRAGCALLGGETAEMPGFYAPGEYDLAGFAVGVVEKAQLIDGSRARAGDVLLGLASSGLHSNGFSLVRKVLLEQAGLGLDEQLTELGGRPLGDVLLEPTRIYVPSVLGLLRHLADAGRAGVVHGMAHITGGGLVENVPRALPSGCHAAFEWGNWPIPPVFGLVQRAGNVPEQEMYRVFNMGIGFVLVVDAAAADEVEMHLSNAGERVFRIGRVEPTRG